jgi:exosortase/archaeosortase family protein
LYFLVPFGDFLVPFLQHFTVRFMTTGLDLLRIPNFSDGITIEIPEGTFLVAEACAGLRFLIASAAFGVFYACLMYTSPLRRLLFIALSLVVPVIANGFRALGIVVLAHFLGSAEAAATDHVLYGWIFFTIVIFALILLGLPFRQPPRTAIPIEIALPRGSAGRAALLAVLAIIVMAAAPRVLADRLDLLAADEPISAGMPFPVLSGCVRAALPPERLLKFSLAGMSAANARGYRCGTGLFVVSLRRYPARIGTRPLFVEAPPENAPRAGETLATRGFGVGRGAAAQLWRITEFEHDGRYAAIASALWIDGRPVRNALRGRIRQALNLLRKAPLPPVKAVVTYRAKEGLEPGRRALDRFLAESGPLSALIKRVSTVEPGPVKASR